MKLRCIGGKNNGKWHHVEDYYRMHDRVQVYIYPKELLNFNYDDPPVFAAIDIEYYSIEQIGYEKTLWKVLIHVDLKIKDYMIGFFEGLFGNPWGSF